MNSLQDLNNFGAVPLDYLDARPSGVRFNREYPLLPLNQEITITSTTVLPSPGIEIEEIINYQTANVRYRVSIQTGTATPLTGSTISWASLPSGATLSQVGDVYTISGIHSPADWDAVKNFTWNLPAAYASYPLWYLLVEIVYYDSLLAEEISVEWLVYDDDFYWVAQLQSTATVTTIGGVKSPATASISATTTVSCNSFNILIGTGTLSSTTTVSVEGSVNVDYLTASSSVSVAGKLDAVGASALSVSTTANFSGYVAAVNLTDRTYLANQNNQIFATNTPVVDTPGSGTVTVVLTSALGQFASSSSAVPVTTLTISGDKTTVNAALINVYFYPTKGSSSSGTFSWQQSLDGNLLFTKTIGLTGFANNFAETVIEYTNNGTFTLAITQNQAYYGLLDLLIVGGGGGAAYAGGGGGAGNVLEYTNLALTSGNKTIVVGAGAAAGSAGWNSIGSAGNSSSAFGYTAAGGAPGQKNVTITPYAPVSGWVVYTVSNPGGNNASFAGGTYTYTSPGVPPGDPDTATLLSYGGGGGGKTSSGQNGGASPGGTGGNGITSTITGNSYARGGWARGASISGPPAATYGSGGDSGYPSATSRTAGIRGYVYVKIHA